MQSGNNNQYQQPNFDYRNLLSNGLGMAGAGFGQMASNFTNPSNSAMNYMNQIPKQLHDSMDPYIQAGQRQLPGLEGQYGQLMNDPGGRMNQIGQSYHESPGFKWALQQALQHAGNQSAAGGMVGTPQHEQQNMGIATGLANQDYNQWLQQALGMYGKGLEGSQSIYDTGAKTGIAQGEDLASVLANQAKLAYEGQNSQNQHSGGMWGSLLGGLGSAAGAVFGGPWGGALGGAAGKWLGGSH